MKMQAPLEIGICCRDLDRLARFYTDVLGFAKINDLEVPFEKSAPSALAETGYRVMRLQTPWGERIKLLQPKAPAATTEPPAWILDRRGIVYLTFIVTSLQETIARLVEAGVPMLTGAEPVEVRPRTFLAFIRDPEDNVLEFVEYGDITEYRKDLG